MFEAARFDDTEVPGVLPTMGYIDLGRTSPTDLTELIKEKLKLSDQAAANKYSDVPNSNLVQHTMELGTEIRQLLERDKSRRSSLLFDNFSYSKVPNNEQRDEAWHRRNAALLAVTIETMSEYARRFKVEAILLRD